MYCCRWDWVVIPDRAGQLIIFRRVFIPWKKVPLCGTFFSYLSMIIVSNSIVPGSVQNTSSYIQYVQITGSIVIMIANERIKIFM